MSGFTPGPWIVVTELRDTDEIICDMLNNGYVAITQGQKLANWRDDAVLISAAPELLEALEATNMLLRTKRHACEITEVCHVLDTHIKRNQAAIAKARGTA